MLEECEVKIKIPIDKFTDEQWKHLYKAEDELGKIGIKFDTGCGCGHRDWEFDWSLSGAKVLFKRLKD